MATKPTTQHIANVVLPDDHLEVTRPSTGATALLNWKHGQASSGREFSIASKNYVGADPDSGLPAEVRLAEGIRDYKSAAALVQGISEVFSSVGGLRETDAALAALFALATFFADCRDPTPRAVVSGRDQWESAQFLKVLACVCRHSLPLARFNEDHLWSLPTGCTPTFLISDTKPSKALLPFLSATQHSGFALTRAGKTVSASFSAVILECEAVPEWMAPNSFLRIDTTPRIRPKLLAADDLRKIEERFQPQLLLYRLHHRPRIAKVTIDASGLDGSTRALASDLASCFPDDEVLQRRAVELMKPQDEARRLDISCARSAVVLDALLALCHQDKAATRVGEVATTANGILDTRGDGYRLTARAVGSILKAFGLVGSRGGRGYNVPLTTATKLRIHQLGRAHDVPFFKADIHPCEFCTATSAERAL